MGIELLHRTSQIDEVFGFMYESRDNISVTILYFTQCENKNEIFYDCSMNPDNSYNKMSLLDVLAHQSRVIKLLDTGLKLHAWRRVDAWNSGSVIQIKSCESRK